MCADLEKSAHGEHASNLGALLARRFASLYGVPAFVVDPVTTDEFEPPARFSGVPGIERKCRNHALNIKAAGRRVAAKIGKDLEKTRLVVAHLGGGISVCALKGGRIIDSTDALLGEGPFSPERAGTLPLAGMIALCMDSGRPKSDIIKLLSRESGLKGYLGTNRLPEVFRMIDQGNEEARVTLDAMVLQIAKWIGAMAAALKARPDAILLTGGMAHSERLVRKITSFVEPFGPVHPIAGSIEMEALAEGAFRVLNGEESPRTY
jgi:butyrate kinase